ncbi:MAG TPA: hypothetical protein VFP80_08510 [Thermoanaerobaculia bacterium]|nr:hypothetical protein [Thermoanaerobaculia bacterium]
MRWRGGLGRAGATALVGRGGFLTGQPGRNRGGRCPAEAKWSPAEARWSAGEVKSCAGEAKWSAGEAKWSAGEAGWDLGEAKWSAGEAKWSAAEAKWSPGEAKWSPGEARWSADEVKSSAGEVKWSAGEAEWSVGEGKWSAGEAKLNVGEAKLNAGEAKLNAGETKLNTGEAKLNTGEAKLNAGEAKLNAGEAKLNAGEAKLNTGETKLSLGEAKLCPGEAKLNAGEAKLSPGEAKPCPREPRRRLERRPHGRPSHGSAAVPVADVAASRAATRLGGGGGRRTREVRSPERPRGGDAARTTARDASSAWLTSRLAPSPTRQRATLFGTLGKLDAIALSDVNVRGEVENDGYRFAVEPARLEPPLPDRRHGWIGELGLPFQRTDIHGNAVFVDDRLDEDDARVAEVLRELGPIGIDALDDDGCNDVAADRERRLRLWCRSRWLSRGSRRGLRWRW